MVSRQEHSGFHGRIFNASGSRDEECELVSGGAEQLTSLLVAVAGGKKRSVACQQLDWQRFDPPYQRHRHPRVLDRHHPGHRGHPATVLEQPEERRRGEERPVGLEEGKVGEVGRFTPEKVVPWNNFTACFSSFLPRLARHSSLVPLASYLQVLDAPRKGKNCNLFYFLVCVILKLKFQFEIHRLFFPSAGTLIKGQITLCFLTVVPVIKHQCAFVGLF